MNGSAAFLVDGSHEFAKRLIGRISVQGLSRPVVYQVGNGVQRILAMDAQVHVLGQELAQQAIGVLAAAFLSGTVRIAEVHVYPRGCRQFPVSGFLLALVIGECLAHWFSDLVQLIGERRQCTAGRCIGRLAQKDRARGTLHQHTHHRLVAPTFDQVALPVPWHHEVIDLRRAYMDGDHVGELSTPVTSRRMWPVRASALAQQADELAAQFASRISVDGGVDALVRDMQAEIVWVHAPECAGNLLWRPAPGESRAHDEPQAAIAVQLGQRPRGNPPLLVHARGRHAGVGPVVGIAPELTADGAGAASQQLGHTAHAPALPIHRRRRHSLFRLQVRVCRIPSAHITPGEGVALRF